MNNYTTRVEVDEHGHLIVPPELMKRYGLVPGASLLIEEHKDRFSLVRSTASLCKVYVEPTNLCNLDCRTCMRNAWDEPLGKMTMETFAHIIRGIKEISPIPTVFFGGFGEPMAHPDLLEMVAAAQEAGAEVEMITIGTLLTKEAASHLVELGLNRLWVSIDGATPASYADVRLGDALPLVIANLTRLKAFRLGSEPKLPKLGIAFVAMRRNIADLPEVIRLGKRLGADQFSVSNVLPHTAELRDQMLYKRSMSESNWQPSHWSPVVSLPRLDLDATIIDCLTEILKDRTQLEITRQSLRTGVNTCPFLEKGSISIRWDGAVSPCLPLMHTHASYLDENLRTSCSYSVGNIQGRSLVDLWNDPEYIRLRERLQAFDFSPCTFCASCTMSESNLEDCFGNSQPTCGGCLWAQGFIQCP